MNNQVVTSAPLRGEVRVVGDKSISHRALLISALAAGRSLVRDANPGADVRATARCLRALGIGCSTTGEEWTVEGSADALREPSEVLDAGNSGTTLRILLGVLAGVPGLSVVTGDATLRRRPMLRVVEPLRRMGAAIDGRRNGDLPPLVVRGRPLRGAEIETQVASAQVKTALLLAALRAEGRTVIREPAPSRDHTERMLAAAGIDVSGQDGTIEVAGGQAPAARRWSVPGDLSAALYLIVAGLLVPGSDITVTQVGLNPTRTAALDVLRRMGGDIRAQVEGSEAGEPVGRVRARASALVATTIAPHEIPALIDDLPILAVAATQARGRSTLGGAAELRVKESDRIAAMAGGLKRLGARIEERDEGL
ncbi:3-phosphoshikimate 1-carboxyvinyltransferase [soil metagenome]